MASRFQTGHDRSHLPVGAESVPFTTGAPTSDLNAVLYDVGQTVRPRDQLGKLLDAALNMTGARAGAVVTDDDRGRPDVLVHRADPSWPDATDLLHAPAAYRVPLQLGSQRLGWLILRADHPDRPVVAPRVENTILALAAVAALTLDRLLQGRAVVRKLRHRRDAAAILDSSAFLVDDRLNLFRLDGRPGWGGAWRRDARPAANLTQLLPDAGATVFQHHLRKTFETREPVGFEFDVPLTAGQRHFAVRMHPLTPRADQPLTALVMTHDISRRRSADEKRRHRMTQLRRALDALPVGLLVLEETEDGRRAVAVANRPLDALLKNPVRVWLGEDGEESLDRIQRCFASGDWLDAIRCERLESGRALQRRGEHALVDGTRIGWQVSRSEKRPGRLATEVWSFFAAEPAAGTSAELDPVAVTRLADYLTVVVGLSEKVQQQKSGEHLDPETVDLLVTAAQGAASLLR